MGWQVKDSTPDRLADIHCDTWEQVMKTLKERNWGQPPKLHLQAKDGSAYYVTLSDYLIAVIPDPPPPPAANGD